MTMPAHTPAAAPAVCSAEASPAAWSNPPPAAGGPAAGLVAALWRPVDIAGPAVFRVLFGALMLVSTARFLASGWIDELYGQPTYFFHYYGFSWVPVAPVWALYTVYSALAVLALCVAIGLYYRISILLFCIGFTYTQLLDVTNYLNHYYLVVLLSALMCALPLGRGLSVDAWRKPARRLDTMPAWGLHLLRFQVAAVYIYAGLAKLNSDWLLHAQPLNIWLSARVETPVIGWLFDERWVAYGFSWAGFLFDSTIVFWLSWRRTRPYAYAVLVGFHLMTDVLFNIGMFPYIMMLAAMLLFDPSWPRRIGRRIGRYVGRRIGRATALRPRPVHPAETTPAGVAAQAAPQAPGPLPGGQVPRLTPGRRLGLAIVGLYCAWQVLVPLRHYVYPGDVLWNEEGMRFAWKVMLREKHGSVTYYVRIPATGGVVQVPPRKYLSTRQEREMSGQPDLILALAQHIAADFDRRGYGQVEVRAEALVSLNGRRAAPMIDSQRDLAKVDDSLAARDWILPAPSEPPIRLAAYTRR